MVEQQRWATVSLDEFTARVGAFVDQRKAEDRDRAELDDRFRELLEAMKPGDHRLDAQPGASGRSRRIWSWVTRCARGGARNG